MTDPRSDDPAPIAVTIRRCLWIFATLGPLFGCVTGLALFALESADTLVDMLRIPLTVVMAVPFGLPMAWLVGLLPAILTGIVYWALRSRAMMRVPIAAAVSTIAAGIFCAANLVLVFDDSADPRDFDSWQMLYLPAIVAIPLCAAVVERCSFANNFPPWRRSRRDAP